MSTLGWIATGVAGWLIVAAAVGVGVGRMVRNRDRQQPRDPEGPGGLVLVPDLPDDDCLLCLMEAHQ